MVEYLTFFGLLFTLVGAALLFFYGMPRKTYGNVIISGESAFKVAPEVGEKDVPDHEWQPIADKFHKKAKLLNSLGFALIAIGTLIQMIAVIK